jgi:uncharacterized RDD family membrane protein YckC
MHDDILDFNYDEGIESRPIEYASFWTRVGASLLDTLILLPVAFLNIYNILDFKQLPLYVLLGFVPLVYKVFMEFKYGATLGKMIVKVKVINEEEESVSFEQAIVRNIFYLLVSVISFLAGLYLFVQPDFSSITTFLQYGLVMQEGPHQLISQLANVLFLVSCLFVVFRDNRQALHDSMAGTYVIVPSRERRMAD